MKKVIFYTVVSIFGLFIIIGVWDQVEFYQYKKEQIEKYDMLNGRERQRVLPKIFFDIKYLTSMEFNKKYSNKNLSIFLYHNRKKRDIPLSCTGYLDSYLIYSYFTEKEVDSIVSTQEIHRKIIFEFPNLNNNQVAVLRTLQNTEGILDENFEIAHSKEQNVYTIFNDLKAAELFIDSILSKRTDVSFKLYDSKKVLIKSYCAVD